ncbi:MAG: cytochrome c oxidase subunit II [Dehalococcoidia bacterium]|nr:cytochrome c oxidase subunit II [Dehalococcoidia bacterium]
MQHDTPRSAAFNHYLFEFAWILPSIAIPVAMLVAIAVSAFAMGLQVQGDYGRIDPAKVTTTAPFNNPGLRQVGPGRYEAVVIAKVWRWVVQNPDTNAPVVIRIPVGSTVTFIMTSVDVIHGVKIQDTDVNMMVLPGQISRATQTFNRPGEFLMLCHEYCGTGHHTMWAKIVVE